MNAASRVLVAAIRSSIVPDSVRLKRTSDEVSDFTSPRHHVLYIEVTFVVSVTAGCVDLYNGMLRPRNNKFRPEWRRGRYHAGRRTCRTIKYTLIREFRSIKVKAEYLTSVS